MPVETTRVFGCSTKWSDKQADAVKSLEKWDMEPVKLEPLDEASVAKLVKNEGKKLLLVNVWATYCGPCVTELPEFVTTNRMYRRRNFGRRRRRLPGIPAPSTLLLSIYGQRRGWPPPHVLIG